MKHPIHFSSRYRRRHRRERTNGTNQTTFSDSAVHRATRLEIDSEERSHKILLHNKHDRKNHYTYKRIYTKRGDNKQNFKKMNKKLSSQRE